MPRARTFNLSNLDASESIYFARELEQIKRTSYDVVYPENKARLFCPASQEPAGPADDTITYNQLDRVGVAKMISNYAADLPRVDVKGAQFSSFVKPLGVSFGYNIHEIRQAAKTGKSLPQLRANAAHETIEEQIDNVTALGDTDTGIVGFLAIPTVPHAAVATVTGATTWADKIAADPDLVIDDVADAVADMVTVTKGREYPDTLLMPEDQFTRISVQRLVDRDFTILEFIRKAFPRIKTIEPWHLLTGAGAGSTDRFMLYKKDPNKVFCEVPQEFEALNPQEEGLEIVVPCHARVGGVICPYPLSISYRDGI